MRKIIRFLVPLAIILGVWLTWPFLRSAEKQAEQVHLQLFKTASTRDWNKAHAFLAATYEDQWGNAPTEAIQIARELLLGFLVLDIRWESIELSANENIVKIRGHARIEGNGMGYSQMVMDRANALQEPWVFTWRKDGWKPSDWKLVSVKNAELEGVVIPTAP